MAKENLLDGIELLTSTGSAGSLDDIDLSQLEDTKPPINGDDSPNDDGIDTVKDTKIVSSNADDLIDLSTIKDDNKNPGVTSTDDNQSASPFSALANEYISRGLLPKDNEDLKKELENVENWDSFFDIYKRFSTEDALQDLNDAQKEYLKALRNGVPIKEYEQYQQAIDYLDKLTDDNFSNQAVVKNIANVYYTLKGIEDSERQILVEAASKKSPADVKNMAAALKDYYSNQYKETFDKYGNQTKLEYDTQKVNVEKFNQYITSNELFKGVKLTDDLKQKVIDAATKIVDSKSDRPMTAIAKAIADNPVETQAKIGYLYVMTNGFTDLSAFTRKGMDSATKALKEIVEKPVLNSTFSSNNPDVNRVTKQRTKQLVQGLEKALMI